MPTGFRGRPGQICWIVAALGGISDLIWVPRIPSRWCMLLMYSTLSARDTGLTASDAHPAVPELWTTAGQTSVIICGASLSCALTASPLVSLSTQM